ncbi:Uncharacterised protein [Achromobacter xylosoxidans]|nr:Uncharacterised protein [Achromobacter xylosoxidans]
MKQDLGESLIIEGCRRLAPWGTSRPAHRHPPRLDRAPLPGRAAPGQAACRHETTSYPSCRPVPRRDRGARRERPARHRRPRRRWRVSPGPARTAARSPGHRRTPASARPRDRPTTANRNGTPARRRRMPANRPLPSAPRRASMRNRPGSTARRRERGFVPCAPPSQERRPGNGSHHAGHGEPLRAGKADRHVRMDRIALLPTRQGRGQEKSPVRKPGLRALPDGARAPGRLARPQRCVAMLRAWLAALFRAATGGVLPSSASLSCWLNTGSMRS